MSGFSIGGWFLGAAGHFPLVENERNHNQKSYFFRVVFGPLNKKCI